VRSGPRSANLRPDEITGGQSVTIRAYVDHAREPAGAWSASIHLAPSSSTVLVRGKVMPPSMLEQCQHR